jgi:hypothetical protein
VRRYEEQFGAWVGDRIRRIGGQRPQGAVWGDSVLVVFFGVVVIVKGDAILLSESGVLVLFGMGFPAGTTQPEIKGPGTGLLQLSRFFEATMTTLLHDRAPESEN